MPPGEAPAAAAQGHGPAAATTIRSLPTLVGEEPQAAAAAAAKEEEPQYPHSQYDDVSLLQLLTFSFVTPVVKKGLRKPLQQEDVEEVRVRFNSIDESTIVVQPICHSLRGSHLPIHHA